jgi:hypothetical protein
MYCFAYLLFQARVNIVQYPDSYTGGLFLYYTDESAQVIGITPKPLYYYENINGIISAFMNFNRKLSS